MINGKYDNRLTTVSVNVIGLQETHFEIVEHSRLMEVAESCEVIFSHQNVRIPKKRKLVFGTNFIFKRLDRNSEFLCQEVYFPVSQCLGRVYCIKHMLQWVMKISILSFGLFTQISPGMIFRSYTWGYPIHLLSKGLLFLSTKIYDW